MGGAIGGLVDRRRLLGFRETERGGLMRGAEMVERRRTTVVHGMETNDGDCWLACGGGRLVREERGVGEWAAAGG